MYARKKKKRHKILQIINNILCVQITFLFIVSATKWPPYSLFLMDEENKFVDVCGDYIDEENKENYPNFNLKSKIKIKKENREEKQEQFETEGKLNKNKLEQVRKGPSRKEKSLGKLCAPFLERVALEAAHGRDVHLESVARSMNVEKRRIYDIVNVMEALEVMQKTNKSFYKWHGLDKLPELMFALQRDAQKGELPLKIASVERAMCSFTTIDIKNKEKNNKINEELQQEDEEESSAFGPLTSRDRCGKNSLAQLCRRFLMVLLCNPNKAVSLDVISTMLIKDLDSEGYEPPSRSRCRRIYDIANVLAMMNLVEKINHLFGTKKIPLFIYRGPEPDDEEESLEKKRLSRKIKIGNEKNNEKNSSSIPIPSTEENKNLINSNKRRKMNRVIPQQENREEEKNNFNLPKPLPLHPSNISLPQQLVLYSTENIIPSQQQQMFLLPQTFPCSSNFYCWPTQQQQLQTQTSLKHQVLQNQLQTLQTFPLQSQTQILTSTTSLNKNKSPTKNLTKVRHSVHSILGLTQKENIFPQIKNPVNRKKK
ncbi:hypothetical protein Mgra_00001203 [Meloidogyne graminicola]|uniref:E2F/DP family winged-helix DNA-binding domain-containing protein n=1 Tax=Meloidogyne graminicola TaxID=189291 RepID=A0A8T0A138_9BILA|nr:hypothetical protein Mgra_00001203 [Meloidogyne graminicola]